MSTKTKLAKIRSGSRKKAKAFARIEPGTGVVRYNGMLLETLPEYLQAVVSVPIKLIGDKRFSVNVKIRTKGGGPIGQAYAAAIAVSRAVVDYFKDEKGLKEKILSYDRHLLIGDKRQKEPKKFGGPGARRREQKSYR
ncbi:MAG: 30S ribosomal protein S9 [Nitrososphaeria archaeon]|nr:30S ribosomal protein S9 [Conexivisphaerales archaeon]